MEIKNYREQHKSNIVQCEQLNKEMFDKQLSTEYFYKTVPKDVKSQYEFKELLMTGDPLKTEYTMKDFDDETKIVKVSKTYNGNGVHFLGYKFDDVQL